MKVDSIYCMLKKYALILLIHADIPAVLKLSAKNVTVQVECGAHPISAQKKKKEEHVHYCSPENQLHTSNKKKAAYQFCEQPCTTRSAILLPPEDASLRLVKNEHIQCLDAHPDISYKKKKKERKNASKKKKSICFRATSQQVSEVVIKNTITSQAITYQHWTGSYTPQFSLAIDGEPIAMGEQKNMKGTFPRMCTISYTAQFPAHYSSKDAITIELTEQMVQIEVCFDWKRTPRLYIKAYDKVPEQQR